MKVSDYIVSFLEEKGVTDIFGYPGGAINHLIDSASNASGLNAHVTYHEQGASFAACGYAQASNKLGVAYSTSGPGATNLVTGIANAFFDSIPTLFITGQVDSDSARGNLPIRQRGFQETDVVPIVESISKWAVSIEKPEQIRYCLERAYYTAFEGNPGPVVLDIPNDIQRAEVDPDSIAGFDAPQDAKGRENIVETIVDLIRQATRPVLLFGNGVKQSGMTHFAEKLVDRLNIPAVFSMPAVDILPYNHPLNYGFIGGNGQRYANLILEKCDLAVIFGCRLSVRQIGIERQTFAPHAKLLRIDIDENQLSYSVKKDEISLRTDLKSLFPSLLGATNNIDATKFAPWIGICEEIKTCLNGADDEPYNRMISAISMKSPEQIHITADVGQNLLWTARSFHTKHGQHLYMSAGHGAMGYSIPAAIGIYYATHRTVYAFCGDGGFMMNLQELQFIKREQLPIKIICINNYALGMIRAWQGRYLNQYSQTTEDSGYQAVSVEKIAAAFDLNYTCIQSEEDAARLNMDSKFPELIELSLPIETETKPLGSMHHQSPSLEEGFLSRLMDL